jgi:tape measure domain-containing protein
MANNRISILVALDGADDGLKRALASAEKSFQDFSGSAQQAGSRISESVSGIQGQLSEFNDRVASLRNQMLATFGVAWAAGKAEELLRLGDGWNSLSARLKLATTSQSEYLAAQEALFEVAQDTRSDLESTLALYAKTQQAVRNLGGTQQDALDLTRTIAESFKVSGAAASEAAAGTQQLAQALQSGVLRGDEFNSMMENAPRLAQALADGLGVPISKLRSMAEQGDLTAEKVISALLSQQDVIANEYAQMPLTVEGAMQQAENSLLRYVGQLNESYGVTQKVAEGIQFLAGHLADLGQAAMAAAAVYGGALLKSLAQAVAAKLEDIQASRAQAAAAAEAAAAVRAELQQRVASAEAQVADMRARIANTEALIAHIRAQGGQIANDAALLRLQQQLLTQQQALTAATVRQTEAEAALQAAQQRTAGAATLTQKAVAGISAGFNLLTAAFIGWEIGQFLNKFETVRVAGTFLAESLAKLGVVWKVFTGELTAEQGKKELEKIPLEFDEIRKSVTDAYREGEEKSKTFEQSQKDLKDALGKVRSGLAEVGAESTITQADIDKLKAAMDAAIKKADEKTAALKKLKAGTDEYARAQEAAKQANSEATQATTAYTKALGDAATQADNQIKLSKAYTGQIESEFQGRQKLLQAALTHAEASAKEAAAAGQHTIALKFEREALEAAGKLKALEIQHAADLMRAKQQEAEAAQAHARAVEQEANATGGLIDNELVAIQEAKNTAAAAQSAADGARAHYAELTRLPASLLAVTNAQALQNNEVYKAAQEARAAINAAKAMAVQNAEGKATTDQVAAANNTAAIAIAKLAEATRIYTAEAKAASSANTELSRSAANLTAREQAQAAAFRQQQAANMQAAEHARAAQKKAQDEWTQGFKEGDQALSPWIALYQQLSKYGDGYVETMRKIGRELEGTNDWWSDLDWGQRKLAELQANAARADEGIRRLGSNNLAELKAAINSAATGFGELSKEQQAALDAALESARERVKQQEEEEKRAAQEVRDARVQAAEAYGQAVKAASGQASEAARQAADTLAESIAQTIEKAGEEAAKVTQKFAEDIAKIRDDARNFNAGIDDTIRGIQRNGMDAEAQRADRVLELREKMAAAQKALAKSDLAEAQRLRDQIVRIAEGLSSAVTDAQGQVIIGQAKAAKEAIGYLNDAKALNASITQARETQAAQERDAKLKDIEILKQAEIAATNEIKVKKLADIDAVLAAEMDKTAKAHKQKLAQIDQENAARKGVDTPESANKDAGNAGKAGITARAGGGPVRRSEEYLVGEEGEEPYLTDDGEAWLVGTDGPGLFRPPKDGRILPHNTRARMARLSRAAAGPEAMASADAAARRALAATAASQGGSPQAGPIGADPALARQIAAHLAEIARGAAPERTVVVRLQAGGQTVSARIPAREEAALLDMLDNARRSSA